eukprot:6724252-Prymnesium_polylepis.1
MLVSSVIAISPSSHASYAGPLPPLWGDLSEMPSDKTMGPSATCSILPLEPNAGGSQPMHEH